MGKCKRICQSCDKEFLGGPTAKLCDECKDLTGKRFGQLLVIEKLPQDRFLCQCDCGKRKEILGRSLRTGATKSCGCVRSMKAKERSEKSTQDMIGQKFGELCVTDFSHVKGERKYWNCKCSCGKNTVASTESLKSGRVLSCGHIRDKKVALIAEFGTNVPAIASNKIKTSNSSGYAGVCWNTKKQKWMAYIKFRRKQYYLGFFDDIKDAVQARKQGEEYIHGDFLKWYAEEFPDKWEKIKKNENKKV